MSNKPDTLEDIGQSDLVKLSRELLDATVKSTGIMTMEEVTPAELQKARLVLGFLNATDKVMRTKIQYFKMANIDAKIVEIKGRTK